MEARGFQRSWLLPQLESGLYEVGKLEGMEYCASILLTKA